MSQVRWSVTQGPNQKSWGGGGKQMTLYKVGGGHSHFLVLFVRPIILGV